jgi:hypothetical protein
MPDTIREFVVGLGFQLDEAKERDLAAALEGAVLKANLLATAIEGIARTVVSKVGEVAASFEALYYQSQRTLSSPTGIQAFEFAFKNLGSTVADAGAALESFGYRLRTQPGFENWIKGLGVNTRDAAGQLRDTSQIIPELAKHIQSMHSTATSNLFREALGGIGDQGWRTLNDPDFWNQYNKALESANAAGLGANAAESAVKFEKAWREVWMRIGNMEEGGESQLLTGLTEPLSKLNKWMDDHNPQLSDAVNRVSTSLGDLATQWGENLAGIILGPDQNNGLNDAANGITAFVNALKPLIRELAAFNERSKGWLGPLNVATGGGWGGTIPGTGIPIQGFGDTGAGSDNPSFWQDPIGAGQNWWKSHAPTWAGGTGGAPAQPQPARPTSRGGLGWNASVGDIPADLLAQVQAANPNLTPRQCVELVQSMMAVGNVHDWRRGPSEKDSPAGAALATFGTHGDSDRYAYGGSGTPGIGRDHALKLVKKYADGSFDAISQDIGHAPHLIHMPWTGKGGEGDASSYYAINDPSGRPAGGNAKLFAVAPPTIPKPLAWEGGNVWAGLNASLPVGPSSINNSSKNTASTINNAVTIHAPDPQTAASLLGVHLDRTAADLEKALHSGFD